MTTTNKPEALSVDQRLDRIEQALVELASITVAPHRALSGPAMASIGSEVAELRTHDEAHRAVIATAAAHAAAKERVAALNV